MEVMPNRDRAPLEITMTRDLNPIVTPIEQAKLEAGFLGRLFGTGPNASANIAGAAILACLIFMGLLAVVDKSLFADLSSTLVSIVTLALGYLFGKKG